MPYRSKVALVYLLGFFIDLVNMFIANIAYPEIGNALGATVGELAWIGNAYMLGLSIVIPLSVWLASALGERRLMVLSLALFVLASLAAGLAGSISGLIVFRFVQGLGGGLLIPVGQAMAYRHYAPGDRVRLTSLVMMVALIVPAISPFVGGLIVQALSWRWIFFSSIPLALLTLLLAWAWLERAVVAARIPPLDMPGLLLGAAAMTALLIALTLLGESPGAPAGFLWLGFAVLATGLYVRDALRKPHPVLDLRLTGSRLLRVSMLVYLFVPGVFMGVSMVAVLYLQGPLGLTAASTGALMLPWAGASCVAIFLTRRRFGELGPKPLLLAGMACQGVGIVVLAMTSSGTGYAVLASAYALMGFGGSLCSSTAQSTAMLDVEPARMGHASALWNINRQLGFCLGVAILSMLLNLLIGADGLHAIASQAGSAVLASFRACFLIAATLTLLPVPFVLRIQTAQVLALVRKTS